MPVLIASTLMIALASTAAQTSSPAAPAPAARATAPLSAETPVELLAANPAARAIVARHLPNLFAHPAYEQFKGLSLRALQPYSNGAITDAALASIEAELRALR